MNKLETKRQCIGVSNENNNSQYLKNNRCKVMLKFNTPSEFSQNCRNPNKDMCYMHCDCGFCTVKYMATTNRGLKHNTVKEAKEKKIISNSNDLVAIIDNETDIDKLKWLLRAVSEDVSLDSYISKARWLYRNKDIMIKIESMEKKQRQTFLLLDNEIKKLKEELIK